MATAKTGRRGPDLMEAENAVTTLMGDAVEPRKVFIQTYARSVRELDV